MHIKNRQKKKVVLYIQYIQYCINIYNSYSRKLFNTSKNRAHELRITNSLSLEDSHIEFGEW